MNKTTTIATREYNAAVRTKSFLVVLILMPLMMGGGIAVQNFTQRMGDTTVRTFALIDRSPGKVLTPAIKAAVEKRNKEDLFDKKTGKQMRGEFKMIEVEPVDIKDKAAVERQRFDLSEKVRKSDIFAFVEVGQDILQPKIDFAAMSALTPEKMATKPSGEQIAAGQDPMDAIGDNNLVRYTSNQPTFTQLQTFLQGAIQAPVYSKRIETTGVSPLVIMPLLSPAAVANKPLFSKSDDGKLKEDTKEGQIAAFLMPVGLLMLMFVVVLIGASPLTTNVIEEKQQRIAEVLLGSVSPFELMLGKLLGGVAVALTLAAIYFAGAYYFVYKQGWQGLIPPSTIAWFVLFTILATLMFGALFVAAGAAVNNIKEAQSLITPVMLFVMMPMFLLGPMLQNPTGMLPVAASFFPLSAPMMMTVRLAMAPGATWWEAVIAAAITLLTTLVFVWAAGRIFRIGLLMQGQAPKPLELLRWVIRG